MELCDDESSHQVWMLDGNGVLKRGGTNTCISDSWGALTLNSPCDNALTVTLDPHDGTIRHFADANKCIAALDPAWIGIPVKNPPRWIDSSETCDINEYNEKETALSPNRII